MQARRGDADQLGLYLKKRKTIFINTCLVEIKMQRNLVLRELRVRNYESLLTMGEGFAVNLLTTTAGRPYKLTNLSP